MRGSFSASSCDGSTRTVVRLLAQPLMMMLDLVSWRTIEEEVTLALMTTIPAPARNDDPWRARCLICSQKRGAADFRSINRCISGSYSKLEKDAEPKGQKRNNTSRSKISKRARTTSFCVYFILSHKKY